MLAPAAAIVWVTLHAFQHGLAIAGLNGVQATMTCKALPASGGDQTRWGLTPCVPMTDAHFGLVVAVFTLGGLGGSLSIRGVLAGAGIVGALRLSAASVLTGSAFLACGNSVAVMVLARVVIGVGCGLSISTVPLALASLAPPHRRHALGILTQLGIVLGILAGMVLAFPFGSRAFAWRGVPAAAAGLAGVQLAVSLWVGEIPIDDKGARVRSGDVVGDGAGGGGRDEEVAGEETALLPSSLEAQPKAPLTVAELLTTTDPAVRDALPIVLITQVFQQLSGASPVMYFSTSILAPVFGASAQRASLTIGILKVPATLLPILLVGRPGDGHGSGSDGGGIARLAPLLLFPTLVCAAAHCALAAGINGGHAAPALAGALTFVATFSVGLGPLTWVVLGTALPAHARPAAGSAAVALNWALNFAVGAGFLPLQAWLAALGGGGEKRTGDIFYCFAGACAAAVLAIRAGFLRLERGGRVVSAA